MADEILGNWTKGIAFDLHTTSSTYLGVDGYGRSRFDNTRSEMGELVYQLKYRNDQTVIPKIIELLKSIGGIETFDAIIPVPSSNVRVIQPVDAIAKALGKQRGVPVLVGYLTKTGGAELKGITDPADRDKALEDSIIISGKTDISGKRILLIDDLYRSGATLTTCCNVLTGKAKVGKIGVLTMTKTRSNR